MRFNKILNIWSLSLLLCLLPLSLTAQYFRTTVAYHTTNGKMMTDVFINGQKAHMLIDTGAPCCISYSFAQKLGIQPQQSMKSSDSNGQTVQSHLVTLDSLRIGNTTFNQLQALRWEKGNMVEQFGVDGIIGYNLMRMGIVKFDATHHQLTFTNFRKDLGIASQLPLPLVPHSFVPLISIPLTPTLCDTVMFDSGAAAFYEMSNNTYHRLPEKHKGIRLLASGKGILSLGASGIESASTKHRLAIKKIKIGAQTFKDVTTITTSGYDSRLGAALLLYGDVVIDFKRQLFYYLPFAPKQSPKLYQPEWEVVITVMHNHLTAGMVWNKDLPIKCGDRIIAINGKRYEQVDMKTATTTPLIHMNGDKANITFWNARTQKEETITIKKT